jgi:hypothetical protein
MDQLPIDIDDCISARERSLVQFIKDREHLLTEIVEQSNQAHKELIKFKDANIALQNQLYDLGTKHVKLLQRYNELEPRLARLESSSDAGVPQVTTSSTQTNPLPCAPQPCIVGVETKTTTRAASPMDIVSGKDAELSTAIAAAAARILTQRTKISNLAAHHRNIKLARSLLESYCTVAIRGVSGKDFMSAREIIKAAWKSGAAKLESMTRHGRSTIVYYFSENVIGGLREVIKPYNELHKLELEIVDGYNPTRTSDPNAPPMVQQMVLEKAARAHAHAICHYINQWRRGDQFMAMNAERAAMHWHICIHRLKIEKEVSKEVRKTLSVSNKYKAHEDVLLKLSQLAHRRAMEAGADGKGGNDIAASFGDIKFVPTRATSGATRKKTRTRKVATDDVVPEVETGAAGVQPAASPPDDVIMMDTS